MRTALCFSVAAAALLAGLVAEPAAAAVTEARALQAKRGMTVDEVKALLGEPDKVAKYARKPGQTWTYRLLTGDPRELDLDFTEAGMVSTVEIRDARP